MLWRFSLALVVILVACSTVQAQCGNCAAAHQNWVDAQDEDYDEAKTIADGYRNSNDGVRSYLQAISYCGCIHGIVQQFWNDFWQCWTDADTLCKDADKLVDDAFPHNANGFNANIQASEACLLNQHQYAQNKWNYGAAQYDLAYAKYLAANEKYDDAIYLGGTCECYLKREGEEEEPCDCVFEPPGE